MLSVCLSLSWSPYAQMTVYGNMDFQSISNNMHWVIISIKQNRIWALMCHYHVTFGAHSIWWRLHCLQPCTVLNVQVCVCCILLDYDVFSFLKICYPVIISTTKWKVFSYDYVHHPTVKLNDCEVQRNDFSIQMFCFSFKLY